MSIIFWAIYIAGYLYYVRYAIGVLSMGMHDNVDYCLREPTQEFVQGHGYGNYYSRSARIDFHNQKLCGGSLVSWAFGIPFGMFCALGWPILFVLRMGALVLKGIGDRMFDKTVPMDKIFPVALKPLQTPTERKETKRNAAQERVSILRAEKAERKGELV